MSNIHRILEDAKHKDDVMLAVGESTKGVLIWMDAGGGWNYAQHSMARSDLAVMALLAHDIAATNLLSSRGSDQ